MASSLSLDEEMIADSILREYLESKGYNRTLEALNSQMESSFPGTLLSEASGVVEQSSKTHSTLLESMVNYLLLLFHTWCSHTFTLDYN